MTKDRILAALPKLSRADLETVATMASHLLGSTAPKLGTHGSPVFDALQAALGQRMAYSNVSPALRKQFEKRLPELIDLLNNSFAGWDRNKVSMQAFLRMLFGLLYDDLKARNVNPTIGILVTNLGRIGEVFDDAFPDYRMGGTAGVVLKHFQ